MVSIKFCGSKSILLFFVPALLCFGMADRSAGWCLFRDDRLRQDRLQPVLAVFANVFRAVEQEK
jgi:hypothetical protein